MRSREERRQQNIPQGSSRQRDTVKLEGYAGAPSSSSAHIAPSSREDRDDLLERMLDRENLLLAYKRVVRNGGAPGVDGVTVAELQAYLKTHWETVKAELLAGTYPTDASQAGGNPQTRRRRAAARHPDRDRPFAPASPLTSDEPDL